MPSFSMHPGFCGHGIRCNPWKPTQFIISAAQHYGVTGSGKVYIVDTTPGFNPNSGVSLVGCWGTSDSAFDACFSELDPNLVVVACGDGVKLYNLAESLNRDLAMPVCHTMEHSREVSSVAWNPVSRDAFLSCGWDGAIRLWQAANPQVSAGLFQEHLKEVYEVSFSTRNPTSFLSCSGDGTWKLWDYRTARSSMTQVGHNHDIVLSIDFNKYDGNMFVTGGVDRTVRVWDLRRPQQPLISIPGHGNACRRVRFAPHKRSQFASCGYDYRVNVWDLENQQNPLISRYEQHREFVVGLEWSYAAPGCLATSSWDGTSFFLSVGQPPTRSPPLSGLPPAMPPPRMVMKRQAVLPGLPPPPPHAGMRV